MEAAVERWNAGTNIAEFIISRIRKFIQKKERYDVGTFVMQSNDAQDYHICADNMEIEIRDGFNCNMVIQRYEKRRKIIIYIPCEWKKKIVIKVTGGKDILLPEKDVSKIAFAGNRRENYLWRGELKLKVDFYEILLGSEQLRPN